MRIGIDFDNTIASYDSAFRSVAAEWGLLPEGFTGGKHQVREVIRRLPDGETAWMRLQGRMYGHHMPLAQPMPGVMDFLRRAKAGGAELVVVSHKTQYGHFDPDRVDLRQAARDWLEANGFFELIARERVYFEKTREEKVARIAAMDLDAFVDDLEEVFREPGFPARTEACLFAAGHQNLPQGPFLAFADFSAISRHLLTPLEAAARMRGSPVSGLSRANGGGNNRLYRVETAQGTLALKSYPSLAEDSRDRLGTEFTALAFLGSHGVAEVPRALAAEPSDGFALYSWIEGQPVTGSGEGDIDAALAFAHRLHGLREAEGAQALPPASEACLSGMELVAQISWRLERLTEVAPGYPELAAFLERFSAAQARLVDTAGRNMDLAAELPPRHRTLSPSDFGFHNALRRPDGGLTFLDLEYFGWDDPVKLTADFVLHPGMNLTAVQKERFLDGAGRLYGADPAFDLRLRLFLPLYALRWCMIILNEFLPERWVRRALAGAGDRRAAEARQLAKAQALLSATLEAHP
ncbi:hypothetical protein H261_07963 [Paramagnetospirillum caucaseum]|uniref:Aminoglycoside phosphotransferase domain-containing protein n=1 Tax=Paramagnetospirillum caucaseum TaxID=1244869 RepID=M3ADI4_9PROT|nr:aminoglycoside phosphotransferase family protein [Paramagnetospirillum caucaseum]EME70549.1 hypothetical protein H261_07963 [Paramagnetospirillum caucaseum]